MNNKFIYVILLIVTISLLRFTNGFCQGQIIVQHGSSAIFDNTLNAAVSHAQSGDILYLPGGLVSGTSITLNKKLMIIGPGYHPDSSKSTNPTVLSFPITFGTGSDSSTITGINLNETMTVSTNVIFIQRCLISTLLLSGNSSNLRVNENIISNLQFSGPSLPNCFLSKNIIFGTITGTCSSINFQNNIFLYNGASLFTTGSNCLFENNIFLTTSIGSAASCVFNNNLFTRATFSLTGSGNLFSEPFANIFTSYTATTNWDPTQNFHLKPICQGIVKGTDGTDIGLYGTSSPFKDGGMPFNPHFQSITIPGTPDSNGILNVNFTVKSQN